jgi:radical SAM protein with 4Fe4S-binding SPASM domain
MEQCPPGVDPAEWDSFRHYYNDAQNLVVNEHPAQLDVELNSHCNMSCKFCIHGVRNIKKQELGFDLFHEIITQAYDFGIRSLKLNYMNEPLLMPDLENYIRLARNRGMINVFLSTNGVLLTDDRARSLIDAGLTKLFISIDAINARTYMLQRGSPKYNLVVHNTLNFINVRDEMKLEYPLVRVNFLKNKLNESEESEFVDYWTGKADMVIVQEMYETIDKVSNIFIPQNGRTFRCSFPFKQLVVNSAGDILPCCTMHGLKLKIGNIKKVSLRQAWSSPVITNLRLLHREGNYRMNPVCQYCHDGT